MPSHTSPRAIRQFGLTTRFIEGRHHPIIKDIRGMLRSGELFSGGMVLLETPRMVKDALDGAIRVPRIFFRGALDAPDETARNGITRIPAETEIYYVAPELFDSLGSTEASQGVLALAAVREWREQDLFANDAALIVVLAGVQDPGNLGAVMRAAEAFGASGIVLVEGTVSPFNSKVIRASAGSVLRLPTLRRVAALDLISMLRRHKVRLLSSMTAGGVPLSKLDFSGAAAVALGSEGAGLPSELAAMGERFTIPIATSIESLNVAAAAAVVLYEATRQRGTKRGNRE